MSLERAESIAFAGRLAAAERTVSRLTAADDEQRLRGLWLAAYLAAARGRFIVAERTLRAILRERPEAALYAQASATLGSVLRQTGCHDEARVVESAALRRRPRGQARTHLLIGLVADAVGVGDLAGVDRALRRLEPRSSDDWRVRVRVAWVQCERELLAGRPDRAAARARRALAVAERADARRHIAKSLLFLGAALRESGDAPGARRALRLSRAIARRIGAAPIERVAGELLGRLGSRG